jgi:hypothetical protein
MMQTLAIVALGNAGNDNLQFAMDETRLGGAPAMSWMTSLLFSGGQGDDVIGVQFLDPHGIQPCIDIGVDGGAGADNISFTYQGLLNDDLNLRINGGEGNDVLSAKLLLDAASTGALDARVSGDGGGDALTFNVYFVNPDGSMTGSGRGRLSSFTAVADGGAGYDLGSFTANILVRSVERRLGK